MAPQQTFVSTLGNDTTGDGSIGNPWLTLRKAWDVGTVDPDGEIIWMKADGTYSGSGNSNLDFTIRPAPGAATPVAVLGYGTTPGDNVRAVFDLGANDLQPIGQSFQHWWNLDLTDTTGVNTTILNNNVFGTFFNLKLRGGLTSGTATVVRACEFDSGVNKTNGINDIASKVEFCTFTGAIQRFINAASSGNVRGCLFVVNDAFTAQCIRANGDGQAIRNNSFFGDGGSAEAVTIIGTQDITNIRDCLFEDFAGDTIGAASQQNWENFQDNSHFDCPTFLGSNLGLNGFNSVLTLGNEALGQSPYTDAAGGDFTPVDTGNVFGTRMLTILGTKFRGAVAPAAGAGGLKGFPISRLVN